MIAADIAKALGARRAGSQWMAICPNHEDRTPSLAIAEARDGTPLVHCHAGCEQGAVIDSLKALGLWREKSCPEYRRVSMRRLLERTGRTGDETKDIAAKKEAALRIWGSGKPPGGTLIEAYLHSRGITVEPPAAIRFRPQLKHPDSDAWPAMVALVQRGSDGTALGVHRTWLARDGIGKAPVNTAKMMLGPCRGGAVMLAPPEATLLVGEGIETCLSVMQQTRLPAWAALSTSGLKALELPAIVREVIVLADGDESGEAAAVAAGGRWRRQGLSVRISRPPPGMDFNDVLLAKVTELSGGLHEQC